MKLSYRFIVLLPICALLFLLSSCFGLKLEINLNQNGSGTLELEYQVSKSLEALGRLDGNERWNTIPVGRADFMRSMERLPGMKLLSISSKESIKDITINAKMEFANLEALKTFLDAGGRLSSFSGNASSGKIELTLNDGNGKLNPALGQLIKEIPESYSVYIGMNFPNEGGLKVNNNQGYALAEMPGSEIKASGKKVSCSFPLSSILSSAEGIIIELVW